MGLNELDNREKILFLQEFVEKLIFNYIKDENVKNRIKAEKIKMKFFEPVNSETPENFGKNFFSLPEEFGNSIVRNEEIKRKNVFIRKEPPKKILYKPVFAHMIPSLSTHTQKSIKEKMPEIKLKIKSIEPSLQDKIVNGGMQKIEIFLRDPGIQLIECPGPGKNLVIKLRNKITLTKTTLTEEEIKSIVDHFSREAKIPIVGGILKAAVRDVVISSVLSDYIGSRFVINKKSPYSLIENV